jgi:quinol monooxygenase YgiN
MPHQRVLELARFKVDPESQKAFLAAQPAMVEAVMELDGLDSISLVKLDDGTWLDVVIWSSRDAAESAPQLAASLPPAREWLSHITEDVSMEHGTIHDHAGS